MINKTLGDILGAINSMTSDPYYAGITLDQENAMMQQNNADRIMQQRQAQQSAQLDAIINDGRPLDNRKLLQIMAINPEAGKMLAEQAAQKAKQEQIAGLMGGDGSADADTMAKVGVLSNNPQLMQYANMLEDRKYRKGAWGEFVNQPNNNDGQPVDNITAGDNPPIVDGGIVKTNLPDIDYTKITPTQYNQLLGRPNTKDAIKASGDELKIILEQQKASQAQKDLQNQNQTVLNFLDKKEAAIDRLLSPKSGLTSATGFLQSKLPTISQTTKEAEKDLELIKSMETLDAASMNILKGVLSDTDMALLTAAASGELDLERADATVINSLVRIKNEIGLVRQRLGGKAQTQPTNTTSQNSDGWGIIE